MIKKTYRSAQGRPVNFDEMLAANPKTIAAGNANLNARGDKIGRGGKIIKTAEQLAAESKSDASQKNVSIKKDIDSLKKARAAWKDQFVDEQVAEQEEDSDKVLDPSEAAKLIRKTSEKAEDEDTSKAKTTKSSTRPKRKIVDTDE